MPDDPELGVIGKFFECDFLLQSGDRRYLCRVRKGQIYELLVDPHPVEAWKFAIKAPEHTWQRFLQNPPPPEFNDIWAAAWLGHMTLEGDMKVFMQHQRALGRTLKLLRETATRIQPAA
ncbi:MAG TPA: hypothetical protein VHL09_08905 [Dehalococcoidia bacterium]|nr:hypothetical protein [Dehalococcoidia bacterium]